MIFRENECFSTHATLPVGESEEDLRELISKKQAKNSKREPNNWIVLQSKDIRRDKMNKLLDDKEFQEVWEAVNMCQPYAQFETCPNTKLSSWWGLLRSSCNQIKHVGMPVMLHSDFHDNISKKPDIDHLFEIPYKEGKLSGWILHTFCDIPYQLSKAIYDKLKSTNVFNIVTQKFNLNCDMRIQDLLKTIKKEISKHIFPLLSSEVPTYKENIIDKISKSFMIQFVEQKNISHLKKDAQFQKMKKELEFTFPIIPILEKSLFELEKFSRVVDKYIPINVNQADQLGGALWIAFEENTQMCSQLEENRTNVNRADKDGRTSLGIASEKENSQTCSQPEENGANINQATKRGNTPPRITCEIPLWIFVSFSILVFAWIFSSLI